MNAEGSVRQPVYPLPTTDEIYHLINTISSHAEYLTRIAAISALGESRDPRAVIPLTLCCRDENIEIRRIAVEALSALRSVRSIPVLKERAEDKNEDMVVRRKALMALAEIKSFHSLDGLSGLSLDEEEDPVIRRLAARVVAGKR
jgi:HEAT repeat protein